MGDVLNGPRGKKTSPIRLILDGFLVILVSILSSNEWFLRISDGDLSRRVKLNAIEQIEHVERSEQIERS
jgi:hypothetical protein